MTVKELIEVLQRMPQEKTVRINTSDNKDEDIYSVELELHQLNGEDNFVIIHTAE